MAPDYQKVSRPKMLKDHCQKRWSILGFEVTVIVSHYMEIT